MLLLTNTLHLAAAQALIDVPGMEAEDIVLKSMKIAGDICIYTNHNLTIEKLGKSNIDIVVNPIILWIV